MRSPPLSPFVALRPASLVLAACCIVAASGSHAAASPQRTSAREKTVDLSSWCKDLKPDILDPKVKDEDREATRSLIGFELPAPPASLSWIGAAPDSEVGFRGKVVVLANTASGGKSRNAFKKLQESLASFEGDSNVVLVAIHTPDGAKSAAKQAEKNPWNCSVAIDAKGEWCDSLGLYKDAVTLVVDKRGDVRAAGVSADGAKEAVAALLAEPFNANDDKPTQRPKPAQSDLASIEFPTFPDAAQMPMLGKQAPQMAVDRWMKDPIDDANGKVVVLDFWEPWCGPCRKAIPHMNEMQEGYPKDVVCVGVSGMDKSDFERDFNKFDLKAGNFHYGLALSPGKSMHTALGVRGYPTVFVVSADWKVRWQGHPNALTDKELRPIVEANRKLVAATANADGAPKRKQTWQKN